MASVRARADVYRVDGKARLGQDCMRKLGYALLVYCRALHYVATDTEYRVLEEG